MIDPNPQSDPTARARPDASQSAATTGGGQPDAATKKMVEDQMKYQGVDIVDRGSGKAEQVAKELQAEETWGKEKSADSKPQPAADPAPQPEQDNDYYQGMSP